ncbi:MAG: energy-coupling factor ABC transporter permease [Nanoarchaeota archaeon]
MHTPDGFITSWVCILYLLLAGGITSFSVLKLRRTLTKERLLGIAAISALVFGLQMLNFPINPGTSGHFVGAALITLLYGPYAATVAIALVLGVQAFAFGDGGTLAFGFNVFNMAVVGSFTTHIVFLSLRKSNASRFLASLASVVAAAVSCSVGLWLGSGMALLPVLSAMASTHFFIGIGEAMITLFSIAALSGFAILSPKRISWKQVLLVGGAITVLAVPFASTLPDGLDSVSLRFGFSNHATRLWVTPFEGYAFLGLTGIAASMLVATIGMAGTFLTSLALLRSVRP